MQHVFVLGNGKLYIRLLGQRRDAPHSCRSTTGFKSTVSSALTSGLIA